MDCSSRCSLGNVARDGFCPVPRRRWREPLFLERFTLLVGSIPLLRERLTSLFQRLALFFERLTFLGRNVPFLVQRFTPLFQRIALFFERLTFLVQRFAAFREHSEPPVLQQFRQRVPLYGKHLPFIGQCQPLIG